MTNNYFLSTNFSSFGLKNLFVRNNKHISQNHANNIKRNCQYTIT